jgi:hypothetical protein
VGRIGLAVALRGIILLTRSRRCLRRRRWEGGRPRSGQVLGHCV